MNLTVPNGAVVQTTIKAKKIRTHKREIIKYSGIYSDICV